MYILGLLFNQPYDYQIVLKYPDYTLPPGITHHFTTFEGPPDPPTITKVSQYSTNGIAVTWKAPVHTNTRITCK